jgi:hypothetical protein
LSRDVGFSNSVIRNLSCDFVNFPDLFAFTILFSFYSIIRRIALFKRLEVDNHYLLMLKTRDAEILQDFRMSWPLMANLPEPNIPKNEVKLLLTLEKSSSEPHLLWL